MAGPVRERLRTRSREEPVMLCRGGSMAEPSANDYRIGNRFGAIPEAAPGYMGLRLVAHPVGESSRTEDQKDVHFDTSGVDVSPLVPPLVALAVSAVTSMGGVSGAFLLLPFQVSVLGFTTPAVSATNQLFNVVAIPTGVWRYVREGRMVWPLTAVVVAGTIPGVLAGALVRVRFLPDPAAFKIFAGAVLLYLGLRLLSDVLRAGRAAGRPARHAAAWRPAGPVTASLHRQAAARVEEIRAGLSHVRFTYQGRRYSIPTPALFGVSLVIGVVGGTYGVGGGALLASILVSAWRLPIHAIAGATLSSTFCTSLAAVIFYQVLSRTHPDMTVAPDWALGSLFGLGGMAGIYLGARLQKRIPAPLIKGVLALVVLFVALRYLIAGLI